MRKMSWVLPATLVTLGVFVPSRAVPQAVYDVITVKDGGTITGVVKWSGPAVKPPSIPITKNPEVCDPEGTKVRDLERLIVGPDGGVANTVVYLKEITQGKAMDLPAIRRTLDQKNCRYVPHISLVPVQGEFAVKSSDPVLHTVQMIGASSINLPFPFQNQFIRRTLDTPGVIDLKCNAGHTWMNGVVIVVRHPYVTVTDEHGAFKLTDVPAGDYEIAAWHEGWKVERETQTLDVGTQQMTKRFFFSQPVVIDKKVEVRADSAARVEFQLAAR
ncbi:MAG TPA: carboxypeptidase-like regulatory domain-containing protein [Candidatus Binatia bacterium]|nr:carboxypeptidase-like regulatory domain-containing protein [Candidatus Binatia bacterium]